MRNRTIDQASWLEPESVTTADFVHRMMCMYVWGCLVLYTGETSANGKQVMIPFEELHEVDFKQQNALLFGPVVRDPDEGQLLWTSTLWLNIDLARIAGSKGEVLDRLDELVELSPSIICDSHTAIQAYWLLANPTPVELALKPMEKLRENHFPEIKAECNMAELLPLPGPLPEQAAVRKWEPFRLFITKDVSQLPAVPDVEAGQAVAPLLDRPEAIPAERRALALNAYTVRLYYKWVSETNIRDSVSDIAARMQPVYPGDGGEPVH